MMSKKWNVYVARKLPEPLEEMLREYCEVEINPRDVLEDRKVYLQKIKGKDGLITDSRVAVTEEVYEAAGPQLKIVSNYAVGFNNIDVAGATKRGIVVTNTPGVVNNATADIAWALMFAAARRISEADRLIRTKEPWGWTPSFLQGRDIVGKTLGIIGAGRIGTTMAKRARGFDMNILYSDRSRNETLEQQMGARQVDVETLLREADYVSLHTPLTAETRHMISAKQFEIMKPTAILINTSRGEIIDEKALVEALRTGQIWGAGLDVFEKEPCVTPELFELDNIVMTPHIGTATIGTRRAMAETASQNVIDIMLGKPSAKVVNPEVLK
ncbi:MAG TPA: D-glycerate dehydrogenase [Selenomonadales bacterium]|nr:D-glycerate dehydrogenase [Selenomonadales bacterium]